MKDTDDYHALNELVGVEIITDEMRALIRSIGKWREEIFSCFDSRHIHHSLSVHNTIFWKLAPDFGCDHPL